MKKLHAGLGALLGGFLVLGSSPAPSVTPGQPAVVVGTFDSRALVLAHVGSAAFQSYLGAQKRSIDDAVARAKAAGDTALVADLEALGPAMQRRIHEQGFGAAPVSDLSKWIEAALPRIAAKAGVDVIVSKWALTYRRPEAQLVDVTDLLVAEFAPSEETLERIREIVAKEPIPLDQIHHDH